MGKIQSEVLPVRSTSALKLEMTREGQKAYDCLSAEVRLEKCNLDFLHRNLILDFVFI